jgi:peptidoglycan/xylan/chitin deacetylase (PgdA/CDA1 family)
LVRTTEIAAIAVAIVALGVGTARADAGVGSGDPMPAETGSGGGGSSSASGSGSGGGSSSGSASGTVDEPSAPVLDVHDLTSLTADPILNKADRVMGDDVTGVVAFTFDDGPNPETTPAVIDALEKYDIPATFFIVTQRLLGKHGERSREVLADELAGGFTVGSHSVTHPNLGKATGATLDKEIDASLKTLAIDAHRPIGLFRPPYGALSGAGRTRLHKLGLTEVIWSVDTLDWRAKDAARLRKKVLTMIIKQNGGVVLMHDVKPITAKIIASVFDDLEAENCSRLADNREPIIPVSLHYFLKDNRQPRSVPDLVKARTAGYRAALPARCARRAPVPTSGEDPAAVTR